MRDAVLALVAFGLFAVLSSTANADPSAKSMGSAKDHNNAAILVDQDKDGRVDMDVEEPVNVAVFSRDERDLILGYFKDDAARKTSASSHRQKPDAGLPSGMAQNVERGEPLSPGVRKAPLPTELEARLPDRSQHARLIVGNDVLLTTPATGVVVDIIEDVIN